ncbi:hypothetical protein GCM10022229_03370 [Luteimonas lutimaris]|uniref:Large ribosomal subunit protein bL28 n=2 Tax=Luteimonas lutimaris TaxID=698645 RepID=A0ABP7M6I6_9GAMM
MRGSLRPVGPSRPATGRVRKRDSGPPPAVRIQPVLRGAIPSGCVGAAVSQAMGDNNLPSRCVMSRTCQVTGKRVMSGNNVSHANNKTRRRFLPNLHERRFWVASENRWVKLRVSTAAMRTIDKNGIDVVLAELRARGEKV